MSYEFRIGLLAAISIVVTVWGYKFMKGRNLLNPSNYYYAEYENIDELAATSPILIRGLRIGTVSEVRLSDDMQKIVAKLDINRGIRIPKNTEALVVNTSIMGGKAVVLNVPQPCSGDDCAKRGEMLQGRVQGLFESMFAGQDIEGYLRKIKSGVGEIVTDISDSLSASGASNEFARTFRALQHMLINMEAITKQISGSMHVYDRQMQATLGNIETLTGTLASGNAHIASAIGNLDTFSRDLKDAQISHTIATAHEAIASLDEAITKADKSFQQLEIMLGEINSGDGTLGMLIQDKALYNNFTETSRQLSLLLQDLRLNPKRYVNVSVIGRRQRDYEVPENDPARDQD